MAKQFPQFDGKMHINQEVGSIDDGTPDEVLYAQITKKYAPKIALQAFGQFGFMDREDGDPGPAERARGRSPRRRTTTRCSALKNVKTSMLCKPWYVGSNLAYHIPNNADITVTYKAGEVVDRGRSASRSRRSIRSSRRRARGRRSST